MQTQRGPVAVIRTGLIGRGWSIVFARAGHDVRMYDAHSGACPAAIDDIRERVRDLQRYELVDDPTAILARLHPVASLAEALADVELVQECVLETVDAKRTLFAEIDAAAPAAAILASSSSGIPASVFTAALAQRERCIVAHPANPPYLIPLVEVVPAPWTLPAIVERAGRALPGSRPRADRREA